MHAVILAGGLGTRLRPITLTRPKPLVPVLNVPILDHLLAKMPPYVDRVVLAASYRLDDLREYADHRRGGPELLVVEERELLGTAGAIKNVERHVDGRFFVLNGDILDSLDLDALLSRHRERGGVGTISLWPVDDPRPYGVVALEGDRITRFVEKPASVEDAPSRFVNAGTYVLEPEVFARIPAGRAVSIERETFPDVLSGGAALNGFPFGGYWVDCGRPSSFLDANATLLRGRTSRYVLGGGASVEHGTLRDWAVVGPRSELHALAELARSVLLDDVVVGSGAVVEDSILGANVRVGKGAKLTRVALGDGVVVPDGAEWTGVAVPAP